MIEAAIRARLLDRPEVAELVGPRVYEAPPPQASADNAAAWPVITYQVITKTAPNDLEGRGQLAQARIQIDCWAPSSAKVEAVAAAVRDVLHGKSFVAGGIPVSLVEQIDGGGREYEPETKLRRVSMDFRACCSREDL